MRVIPSLLSLIVFIGFAQRTSAQQRGDELVRATLMADVAEVGAGKPFTVGVVFQIERGWHIYWSNPGDAGEATNVTFTLPPSFTVSDLKFPAPHRFVESGDIVSYGYQEEVMLLATITPSSDLNPGEKFTIDAHANWLVCEKICLPGEANAKLDLVAAEKAEPANAALFKKWTDRLPRPFSEAGVTIKSMDNAMSEAHKVLLLVNWKDGAPKNMEVFPPAVEDLVFSNLSVTQEQSSVVSATISALPGKTFPAKATFNLVIGYDDAGGDRRAIVFPMTVSAPPK